MKTSVHLAKRTQTVKRIFKLLRGCYYKDNVCACSVISVMSNSFDYLLTWERLLKWEIWQHEIIKQTSKSKNSCLKNVGHCLFICRPKILSGLSQEKFANSCSLFHLLNFLQFLNYPCSGTFAYDLLSILIQRSKSCSSFKH